MNTDNIRKWFLSHKRDLPWRNNKSPYHVWISEIMLQQTQVSIVIPYFNNWMKKFPNIEILSNSSFKIVLKTWEGLGYYSRVKNIHAASKYLTYHHNAKLPNNENDLYKIPGLGPYTVGAILAFAFHKKKEAVDANVLRVFARSYGILESIDSLKTKNIIRKYCYNTLPDHEPWVIMEAFIELGALICKKKPKCMQCPIQTSCVSYKECKTDLLPIRKKPKKQIVIEKQVAIICSNNKILIKSSSKKSFSRFLSELPNFNLTEDTLTHIAHTLKYKHTLTTIDYFFTHHKVILYPKVYETQEITIPNYEWIHIEKLKNLSFSSGNAKILKEFILLRTNQ